MSDIMNIFEQNDIHEFLTLFLDKISVGIGHRIDIDTMISSQTYKNTTYDKLKKKMDISWFLSVGKDYSPMIDLFNGQSIVQIVCGHCNKIHHVYEPFSILALPVPKQPSTLIDCIKHYTTEEYLNSETNEWKCDGCNQRVKSLKTMKFWRLPKVLMVCLKRFTQELEKNNVYIDAPDTLDLADYMIGPTTGKSYKLKSIGCHTGNFYSGHYYALCCNPDGSWYRIDDTVVTDTDKNEQHSNAYMLFYEIH